MQRFQRYDYPLSIVQGIVLSRNEILGGSKLLFSLFTAEKGKIGAILNKQESDFRSVSVMDYIEVTLQTNYTNSTLFAISSLEKRIIAKEHFYLQSGASIEAIQMDWSKALFQAGRILHRLLLQATPRNDVWQFLSPFYETKAPLQWPETFLLFILAFFFPDEGIDFSAIMNGAKRLPKAIQKKITDEIELFTRGEETEVKSYRFSEETVAFFLDLLNLN